MISIAVVHAVMKMLICPLFYNDESNYEIVFYYYQTFDSLNPLGSYHLFFYGGLG